MTSTFSSLFISSGSGIIAALSVGRNAVAVEIDHWQFLHSQIRAVDVFSTEAAERPSTTSEAEVEAKVETTDES